MGRPPGVRNQDHDETRSALLARLGAVLTTPEGKGASFRGLADHVAVSPATLRHYFGNREALLKDVLAHLREQGGRYLVDAASRPIADAHESLSWLLARVVEGWRHGVGGVHLLGLTSGLGDEALGPAYVDEILEPTLQAAEARIARHVAEGTLGPCDIRHAALELLSPVVLALLHQDGLFGRRCRPLDVEAFVADHVERFLLAHRPLASSAA